MRTTGGRPAGDSASVLQVAESVGSPVQDTLAAAAHRCRAEFALVEGEGGAALAFAHLEAGLDGEGRPSAWHFRQAGLEPGAGHGGLPALPYRFAARRVESTGRVAADATAFHTFCVESALDELAAGAGADPLDFRLQHLADARWRHTLQAAATAAGWGQPLAAGSARGLAVGCCFHSVVAQVVELRRGEDGHPRAERVTLALDSYLPLAPQRSRAMLQHMVQRALARWLDAGEPVATPAFELLLVGAPGEGQRTLVADGVASLALPTLAPALANALCRLGEPRSRRLATGPV